MPVRQVGVLPLQRLLVLNNLLSRLRVVTIPIIRDFLEAVRAEPQVIKLVAVGFCFGGRHAILAASGEAPLADAAVALNPVCQPVSLSLLAHC